MEPDFSGYATKAGLKCTDGRTIMPDAFKHMDGVQVPLVWQHMKGDPQNILGHAVLESRADGIYAKGFLNKTPAGIQARALLEHNDIDSLSIFANQLVEKSKQVFHGIIREVSLVLAGANPGAKIDYVRLAHSDGEEEILDDEAVIYTGLSLVHGDGLVDENEENEEDLEHEEDGPTVGEIYDSMTDDQKAVLHFMVASAAESMTDDQKAVLHAMLASMDEKDNDAETSDIADEDDLNHQEGTGDMPRNVFENNKGPSGAASTTQTLTHEDIRGLVQDAMSGGSMRKAVEQFALSHGIQDIELLFPDAKNVDNRPEFDKRRTEWVAGVLSGTKHSPFSRIKNLVADITMEEARALGYVKGDFKKEEFFSLTSRKTTPTTVYKKQKFERDDLVDITDFDVVAWVKGEMRLMLEEELGRAILIGDGREAWDPDKVRDPAGAESGDGIRSIYNDHPLYAAKVYLNLEDAASSYVEFIDSVTANRHLYKGSGSPTFYTTENHLSKMLVLRDGDGKRLYRSIEDLASELRVSSIVPVEVMETIPDLIGIMVNLQDYTIGADKGGETSMFDDFDIDYNQLKYLMETRLSGALTKIRSALVFVKTAAADVLIPTPEKPSYNNGIGVVSTPAISNVKYYVNGAEHTGTTFTMTTPNERVEVEVRPSAGYYFADNAKTIWTFVRR